MAGIKINVRIDDAEVKALLTRLKERVEDLTPVMQTIGQIVRTSVGKNFEQGGRPSKWGTSQRAKRSGGLTLVDTARLKNSINAKATSKQVSIGTNVVYGAIHQLGGKAGRGKKVTIPARPFLAVQAEDWTEINKVIGDHLLKA
ncbi:phage virion morphogenesis protein [candidate division KSB1 bacterium RBG_16_48_16]|nr:MAG: phage virion morphogenesis protein [candidate division KSB1 bacterium RBG_16_48_16]